MRTICLTRWAVVALLLLPPFCFGQEPTLISKSQIPTTADRIEKFVPAGLKIEEQVTGNLNGDSVPNFAVTMVEDKRREPYIGEWSNGRGERLVITASTIRFNQDKAVNFRDVTRVTNGREFNLEITTAGNLNYLTKFLHISFGEGDKTDEMKMTLYDSRKDMEDGENSQGEATWYRDK